MTGGYSDRLYEVAQKTDWKQKNISRRRRIIIATGELDFFEKALILY